MSIGCGNGLAMNTWRPIALQWGHNERDGALNHQPHDCLLNRLFRLRAKKTSKFRVIGPREGNSPVTSEFPAQRPVTRKLFPFHDVIMAWTNDGLVHRRIHLASMCW